MTQKAPLCFRSFVPENVEPVVRFNANGMEYFVVSILLLRGTTYTVYRQDGDKGMAWGLNSRILKVRRLLVFVVHVLWDHGCIPSWPHCRVYLA